MSDKDEFEACNAGDHELGVVDASFDHEFGVEQILYYQCSVCDCTHDEDNRIPEEVD